MKLYYFNPNNHGEAWFVVSDSKENAIKALNEHFVNNEEKYANKYKWVNEKLTELYESPNKNKCYLDNEYTIDVFEPNQVVNSKIAKSNYIFNLTVKQFNY